MQKIGGQLGRQAGFNIIELMVVLFVGSILVSIGLPAMSNFMANNRMAASSNEVSASMHMARGEAIKRRANVTVCPSNDWNAASPGCDLAGDFSNGWIIFIDSVAPVAPNRSVDGAQVLFARGPLNDDVTMTVADNAAVIAGNKFITFGSNGYPVAAISGDNAVFNLQLCDHRGDIDVGGGIAAGRWIRLSRTGRPQIQRQRTEVQATANPAGGC